MTIQVGDKLPAVNFKRLTADGIKDVSVASLTSGKKVVLFAVPGAFTPTCSERHLPGFVEQAEALKAKGVDTIACIAVNDPFVMSAWEKARNVDGKVEMLSDGNGEFTRALGLDFDGSGFGLGRRSRRYAMVVEDGRIKTLLVEDVPSQAEKSSASAILATL
jgi:glutaredoxin/glutathione-dependent peroxiredoxin